MDGKRLYGGREKLELFDIATGKSVGAVETGWVPGSGTLNARFAFDGNRVMQVRQQEATIHDIATGRLYRTLKPVANAAPRRISYKDDLRDGIFLKNPDFVLLIDQSGTGCVWNVRDEKVVLTQEGMGGLTAISTDGRRLFGATSQFGVTIWDVPEF